MNYILVLMQGYSISGKYLWLKKQAPILFPWSLLPSASEPCFLKVRANPRTIGTGAGLFDLSSCGQILGEPAPTSFDFPGFII